MSDNPYTAPAARVEHKSGSEDPVLLYSPTQAACGTIGGPVGLIYFLRANFVALGDDQAARKTILYGVIFILALIAIIPLLPDKFPSSVSTVVYIFLARHVVSNHQMTKEAIAASPIYGFQSNWRVFGLGLLCLVASIIVLVVPLMLLVFFGVMDP